MKVVNIGNNILRISKLLKIALILPVVASVSGCMATRPVYQKVHGGYNVVKDNSKQGHHFEPEPKPAYAVLYLITVPFDAATFPIQYLILGTAFINKVPAHKPAR